MSVRIWFVTACILAGGGPTLAGCVKAKSEVSFLGSAPAKPTRRSTPGVGERIARAASYTLKHYPAGFRDDCSGFVEATLARVGIPLQGSTRMLWVAMADRGWTHHRRAPRPGDLAFFDDTYDRNKNGRRDDDLSHIAIVLGVRPDGTIVLAHAGTSSGRSRFTMNLSRPRHQFDVDGSRINDALRRGTGGSTRGTLAAELLRGFATIRAR